MNRRVRIICTDRGEHPPTFIGLIDVDDDGAVREVLSRRQWRRGERQGRAAVGMTGFDVVPAVSMREDFDGRERWRLNCRRCAASAVMAGAEFRDVARQLADAGVRSWDIKRPRG